MFYLVLRGFFVVGRIIFVLMENDFCGSHRSGCQECSYKQNRHGFSSFFSGLTALIDNQRIAYFTFVLQWMSKITSALSFLQQKKRRSSEGTSPEPDPAGCFCRIFSGTEPMNIFTRIATSANSDNGNDGCDIDSKNGGNQCTHGLFSFRDVISC